MIDIVMAVAPPLALATLFTIAIRAIIHADRRERAAQARADAAKRSDEIGH